MRSLYDELGVEPTATAKEITEAYLFLAQKFHPDLNRGKEKQAHKLFVKLQSAYDVLGDQKKRAKYDFDNQESLKVAAEQPKTQPAPAPAASAQKKATPVASPPQSSKQPQTSEQTPPPKQPLASKQTQPSKQPESSKQAPSSKQPQSSKQTQSPKQPESSKQSQSSKQTPSSKQPPKNNISAISTWLMAAGLLACCAVFFAVIREVVSSGKAEVIKPVVQPLTTAPTPGLPPNYHPVNNTDHPENTSDDSN